MRRDNFTLAVEADDPATAEPPLLVLRYEGTAGALTARLTAGGDLPDGEEVDASYRLHDPIDANNATGVFSFTRRLTGEYLLEANAGANAVRSLVDAARAGSGSYRVRIERPRAGDVTLDKETLLVYDSDGNLLRKDSLIPSGVEL
jgi:hypothetical protein